MVEPGLVCFEDIQTAPLEERIRLEKAYRKGYRDAATEVLFNLFQEADYWDRSPLGVLDCWHGLVDNWYHRGLFLEDETTDDCKEKIQIKPPSIRRRK